MKLDAIKNYKSPAPEFYKDNLDKDRLNEVIKQLKKVNLGQIAKEQKNYELQKKKISKLKVGMAAVGAVAATAILVASIASFILGTISTGGLVLGLLAGAIILMGTFKDVYLPVNNYTDALKRYKKINEKGNSQIKAPVLLAKELMSKRLSEAKTLKQEIKYIKKNIDNPACEEFKNDKKTRERFKTLTKRAEEIHNQRVELNKLLERFRVKLGKENAIYFLSV